MIWIFTAKGYRSRLSPTHLARSENRAQIPSSVGWSRRPTGPSRQATRPISDTCVSAIGPLEPDVLQRFQILDEVRLIPLPEAKIEHSIVMIDHSEQIGGAAIVEVRRMLPERA